VRLKRVEIIGFKSFADKTVLEFSPGITAIVGPNGCGKSNISDAFRWVLGEQSAKSMRGNKMPDVIFAGTTRRQPLNIAEVTITLTDIEGELPIDFGEVSVTRRLHRSGESQYFINRHPVRLKDVQSLFLDSGMGKDAFSIFEQGKIDQVINFSPLERRYIFEEAAGILRFLQRKREALRKLEQTDLNVSRVKDIHQEVEKQIIVLEQQAAKARLYKEHKNSLEILEKTLFVAKADQLEQRRNEIEKKAADQQQHCTALTQKINVLQQQLQELKQNLTQGEQTLRTKSEELYRARSNKEIKTRERQTHQERLKETQQKETRWQQELEALAEKSHHREIERRTLLEQEQELENSILEHEKILKTQQEKTRGLENAVSKLREQQQASQHERIKLLQAENQIESELKQNQVRQDNQHERCAALNIRRDKLNGLIKEIAQIVEDKKQEMQAASEAVDNQKNRLQTLDERIEELSDQSQAAKNSFDETQQEIADAKARQKALLRLRDEMEGFSAGSKRLLNESIDSKSPLFNLLKGLYEFITPNAGAEAALATALRPYAQTLVVETKEHFNTVLAFAKQQQLKDFSALCLESLHARKNKSAEALPAAIPLLKQVSDHPLAQHFLQHVTTADTLETAMEWADRQPGGATWTNEGLFLDSNRVLFFTSQGENNVFLREAELKTLEKKLTTLEARRQKLDTTVKELAHKRTELHTERTTLDKNLRRDEMKLVEVNFGLQRVQNENEKALAEQKQLETELQVLTVAIENVKSKISELVEKHAAAKGQGFQIQQHCLSLESDLEKQLSTVKLETKQLQDKEAAYRKASEECRKVKHALQILEVRDRESQQQEKRLAEEIQMSRDLRAHLLGKGADAEQELQGMEKILSDSTQACTLLEQELTIRKKSIETSEEQIQKEHNRLKQHEEEQHRVSIQLAQNESANQALISELQERYQLTLEQARATASQDKKSIDQTEKQIRSLRQEIENAGDVNMTSIDEFDKHKTRYEFLNQQIDDLDGSKQELVQIITQLDNESRKIFKDTFATICANFKKNFNILFNGGEADLQFTETADVLEAGIEIIAKPPGKQMRSINLLSGGEKCLTAMALLFAIFEVKPAPFCILDEIDAPLDDTNVERFANVVKQFIERCQFIIITHNKRTMSIADILFGVSMEERGVSKLLSMQFQKEEQEREPVGERKKGKGALMAEGDTSLITIS
jgi:chromosome segregation protein